MGRFISRTRGRNPKLSKVIESLTIQDPDGASPTGPIGEKLTHAKHVCGTRHSCIHCDVRVGEKLTHANDVFGTRNLCVNCDGFMISVFLT